MSVARVKQSLGCVGACAHLVGAMYLCLLRTALGATFSRQRAWMCRVGCRWCRGKAGFLFPAAPEATLCPENRRSVALGAVRVVPGTAQT